MSNTKEFIFMWKIHNFSCGFYKCGETIDSPTFEVNSFGGSQWCIRLYPNGENEEYRDLIAIYLYKKKNDIYSEESSLSFEVELIGDGRGSAGKAKHENCIFKINERHGWFNFLLLGTVSYYLKKWPGNVLTVRCHMFNNSKQMYCPDLELHSEIPVNRISFLWNVKISEVSSNSIRKDLIFAENSLYEINLSMPGDEVKVCLSQKEETTLPKFVECKLSLIKTDGNVLKSKNFTHLFETNDKSDQWEFPSFITKAELDSNSDILGIDSFSLFCEVAASKGIKPVITTKIESNSTFSQDLKAMLRKSIHYDIKLKVENEEMHAHKSVLASRSPVFAAMFNQNMVESQTGVLNIPDFEADTVKLFLEFLYTDTVENFDYENAKRLFVVADKYQVSSLVKKCNGFLESSLSLKNATEILSIADMISHEHLKKAALNFIATNSIIIFNTPEWKILIQENVKLVDEIISTIASNFRIVPNN